MNLEVVKSPRMEELNAQITPQALARDPSINEEQLRALRTVFDPEIDRLLAKHPNSPADLLEDLSHSADKATRRQVVRNGSTPKEVLVRLAPQFPRDFLCNPVIDWMLIEEPDLLQNLGKGVLRSVLKSPTCPEALMGWAARNGAVEHQLALTMNPAATPEILETLAAVKGDVSVAARAHLRYPKPSRLANGTSGQFIKEIKSGLANLPADHAQSLWRRGLIGPPQWLHLSAKSRAAVIGLPASLRGGREPDSAGCRAFAKSVSGSHSLYEFLAKHPDEDVRLAVARNPAAPAFILESLAKEKARYSWSGNSFSEAVARNPGTPLSLLETLAKDASASVRKSVASNPRATVSLLETLSKDKDKSDRWGSSRVRKAVAENPSTPPDLLKVLAQDVDEEVRAAVAKSTATSLETLSVLAADKDATVRLAVANNISTPAATLEVLAQIQSGDWESERVIEAILKNKTTPQQVLEALAQHENMNIRLLVAKSEFATPQILERYARDRASDWQSQRIVDAALKNPKTPRRVLEAMATDESVLLGIRLTINTILSNHKPLVSVFELGSGFSNPDLQITWTSANPIRTPGGQPKTQTNSNGFQSQRTYYWLNEAADQSTPINRLEELAGKRSLLARWLVAGNPNTTEVLRNKLAFSLWLALGIDALPSRARELEAQLRPQIRLVMDARHWWHKIKLLAAKYRFPRLPVRLTDEELVIRFERELSCFSKSPELSLAAEVMGAVNTSMLFLQPDMIDRALKSELFYGDCASERSLTGAQRLMALQHPNAPPDKLIKAYRSHEWLERMAVARNPAVPAKLLVSLKKDANRLISKQAVETELLQVECMNWPVIGPRLTDPWRVGVLGLIHGSSGWEHQDGETTEHLTGLIAHREALVPLVTGKVKKVASLDRVVEAIRHELREKGMFEWQWRDAEWSEWLEFEDLKSLTEVSKGWLGKASTASDWQRLLRLASNKGPESKRLRYWLATNLEIPEDVREQAETLLIEKDEIRNCRCMIAEKSISVDVLTRHSSEKSESVRRALAKNPAIPIHLLEKLADDQDWWVRQAVAENKNATSNILLSLAGDHNFSVRQAVAMNSNAPVEVLKHFASQDDLQILGALIRNPRIPLDILREIYTRNRSHLWEAEELIARHPLTPVSELIAYSSSYRVDILVALALNPVCPASVLDTLARGQNAKVRRALATREDVSESILQLLSDDKDLDVRLNIARRKGLSLGLIQKLAKDKSAHLRLSLVEKPETPDDLALKLLAPLSRDRDPVIRRGVAFSRATGNELREALANDDSRDVRMFATGWHYKLEWDAPISGNPAVTKLLGVIRRLIQREEMKANGQPIQSAEVTADFVLTGLYGLHLIPRQPSARFMSQAVKSKDWLTRLAVALHPMATPKQLKQLEKDELPDVVAAVRSRTNGVWEN